MPAESPPSHPVRTAIDQFWMRPTDLRMLNVLRRCFGGLLVVWTVWMWRDRSLFFGSDSWVPAQTAREVIDPDVWMLYSLVPETPFFVNTALLLLGLGGVALMAGIIPRLAAATSFLLLVAVQHANNMLMDSEDAVFRLFAFYLIFVPPSEQLTPIATTEGTVSRFPAWPLRLFQLQICLIYACTAIQKSNGNEWLDGSALYYVFRLDDSVKYPLPSLITESIGMLRLATWSVLAFEFLAPVLLWIPSTRRIMWAVAVGFHLLTHYSMNLHLFHGIMLTGLLSFLRYEEWVGLCEFVSGIWNRRKASTAPK
jgi:hypothetical protein